MQNVIAQTFHNAFENFSRSWLNKIRSLKEEKPLLYEVFHQQRLLINEMVELQRVIFDSQEKNSNYEQLEAGHAGAGSQEEDKNIARETERMGIVSSDSNSENSCDSSHDLSEVCSDIDPSEQPKNDNGPSSIIRKEQEIDLLHNENSCYSRKDMFQVCTDRDPSELPENDSGPSFIFKEEQEINLLYKQQENVDIDNFFVEGIPYKTCLQEYHTTRKNRSHASDCSTICSDETGTCDSRETICNGYVSNSPFVKELESESLEDLPEFESTHKMSETNLSNCNTNVEDLGDSLSDFLNTSSDSNTETSGDSLKGMSEISSENDESEWGKSVDNSGLSYGEYQSLDSNDVYGIANVHEHEENLDYVERYFVRKGVPIKPIIEQYHASKNSNISISTDKRDSHTNDKYSPCVLSGTSQNDATILSHVYYGNTICDNIEWENDFHQKKLERNLVRSLRTLYDEVDLGKNICTKNETQCGSLKVLSEVGSQNEHTKWPHDGDHAIFGNDSDKTQHNNQHFDLGLQFQNSEILDSWKLLEEDSYEFINFEYIKFKPLCIENFQTVLQKKMPHILTNESRETLHIEKINFSTLPMDMEEMKIFEKENTEQMFSLDTKVIKETWWRSVVSKTNEILHQFPNAENAGNRYSESIKNILSPENEVEIFKATRQVLKDFLSDEKFSSGVAEIGCMAQFINKLESTIRTLEANKTNHDDRSSQTQVNFMPGFDLLPDSIQTLQIMDLEQFGMPNQNSSTSLDKTIQRLETIINNPEYENNKRRVNTMSQLDLLSTSKLNLENKNIQPKPFGLPHPSSINLDETIRTLKSIKNSQECLINRPPVDTVVDPDLLLTLRQIQEKFFGLPHQNYYNATHLDDTKITLELTESKQEIPSRAVLRRSIY